jgi:hypothetical protein
LQDWLKNNWLVKHRTSAEEIASLLAIVERDISNSQVAGLSPDWRLNIAYNAALQAATAALAAAGFRAAREQHWNRTGEHARAAPVARHRAHRAPIGGEPN